MAELILFTYIDQMHNQDLWQGTNFSGTNPLNLKLDENNNLKANAVRAILGFYKKNRDQLKSAYGDEIDLSKLNTTDVNQWIQEQKSDSEPTVKNRSERKRKNKEKLINLDQWLKSRVHIFPDADKIEEEVAKALEVIKDPDMHPIRKAAYIWYEIVRIHISHEANKRTGKALASIILLQNGYLPPLITQEDEKRYVDSFMHGFGKEDGFEKFLEFVIEMVNKTQTKFRFC